MSQGYATTLSAVQFTGCTINPAQIANANAWIGTDSATTVGITYNVPTSTTNGHQFTVNGALGFQVGKTGAATASVFMAASQSGAGLLVSGASSITGNIFECDLTSGGTVAMALSASGVLRVGANAAAGTAGDGAFSRSTTTGAIYLGGSSFQLIDYGVTTSGQLTMGNGSGANTINMIGASGTATLNIGTSSGGSGTAALQWAAVSGFNSLSTRTGDTVNTIGGGLVSFRAGSTPQAVIDTSGNLGIVGTLHSASTLKAKKNIAPLSFNPLDIVTQTDWVQYQLIGDPDTKQPHVGFIAENSSEWLGGKEKAYVVPSDLASIAAAGLKELVLKLRAANIAV